MTEPTTPGAARRSRPMIIAAAAVAAGTLAGGIALAVSGDNEDLPVLDVGAAPMAAGGEERTADAGAATDDMAGAASMALWARYEAADELPDLGGSAPVYRMVASDDDLRAIAEYLGVEGEVDGEDVNGQPWEDVHFPAVRADLLGD